MLEDKGIKEMAVEALQVVLEVVLMVGLLLCTKLTSDTKPNIYDRPNTVVIDGHKLSVLPLIEELVPFNVESVLREEVDM